MNKNKPKLVVLSGAGISAESGIATFRDSGGLWEGHKIEEVATPEGWKKNPEKVLNFYNERRISVLNALPNKAHEILFELESDFDVQIVTQNVDDLHERAGSSKVLHLHGEIRKSRSTKNENLVYEIEGHFIQMGDTCELGSQLRPHIVWFGESVPLIEVAANMVEDADILLVIGTSLQVYPAAGLLQYFSSVKPLFLVDPKPQLMQKNNLTIIAKSAVEGMKELQGILKDLMNGK
ncbi:MAG: Sir2 family NAD-dependent protein deacetylase [Bacteroidota bacterium]|nr:Sir2 family NAD-dependent protein deacetylase [Bacteroidota bacterium]